MISNDPSIEREWTTITKLKWNTELKKLVIKCMEEPDFIINFADGTNYRCYWDLLDNYMMRYYKSKPEKPDKFIFLLLLTYPKKYIEKLESFLHLKIAFNEIKDRGSSDNSDFTCSGYYYSDGNNCICSQPIDNVYLFTNNLSHTQFNVGSVCNHRHRVVSEDDEEYKLMKRAERDRREERVKGWPEGYKEQQRLLKKQEKDKNASKKKNYNKKDDEPNEKNAYITDTKCYVCNNNNKKLFSQSSKGVQGICSCIPMNFKKKYKLVVHELRKTVKIMNCIGCHLDTRQVGSSQLCLVCSEDYTTSHCDHCYAFFVKEIKSEYTYCTLCLPNMKHCLDCNKCIIRRKEESYKNRCNDCYKIKKQNEKYIDIVCEICNEECTIVEEQQQWRKTCNACYKKSLTKCQNCDSDVKIQTVKKEGPNKGRNFYSCKDCNHFTFLD
jgi:hypothetical protein